MRVLPAILYLVGTSALVALAAYATLAALGNSRVLYGSHSAGRLSIGTSAFLILAAIGFFTCMYQGAVAMLGWMPSSWGSVNEDGEFMSSAENLAGIFAVYAGAAFAAVLNRATHDRQSLPQAVEQNKHLRKILEASLDEGWLESLRSDFKKVVADLEPEVRHMKSWAHLADGQRMLRFGELIEAVDQQQNRLRRATGASARSAT